VAGEYKDSLSLLSAYEQGLTGYIESPRDKAEFMESQPHQYFDEPNIKGMGAGKRALLWGYALQCDPKSFNERQTTGDCVSHGSRNARDVTRASAIFARNSTTLGLPVVQPSQRTEREATAGKACRRPRPQSLSVT
jgi:hypothetical protein